MASEPYVSARFELEATIGGQLFKDIVSISATFALNAIPRASLEVAVGVDARSASGTEYATIHTARKSLRPRDPVEVRLKIKDVEGKKSRQPEESYVIFKGFLSGIGFQRSANNANFTIQVVHWLDDLNNTSAVHGDWFPSAPQDLAQAAGAVVLGLVAASAGAEGQPIGDIDNRIASTGNVEKDLWLKVLRPLFEAIAKSKNPSEQCKDQKSNDAALKALALMPGDGSAYYKPLALNVGSNSENISGAIRKGLSADLRNGLSYTTLWNKIVGQLGPSFFFSISPCIEYAIPIPFFGGLRKPWIPPGGDREFTIMAEEYSYADFNANMSQILESVIVFHTPQLETFSGSGTVRRPLALVDGFCLPIGEFPPNQKDKDRQGLKLVKELPSWLTNINTAAGYVPSAGVTSRQVLGDTSSGPGRSGENEPAPGYDIPTNSPLLDLKKITDKFCEHWYKTELLQQRTGQLSGRLRFDIAPGSTVSIELPPRDIRFGNGTPDGNMVATVVSTSFVINAERAVAGTSFVLANMRTKEENDDNELTSATPPLYPSSPWSGGPLAKI
jgi:hypothetical protein